MIVGMFTPETIRALSKKNDHIFNVNTDSSEKRIEAQDCFTTFRWDAAKAVPLASTLDLMRKKYSA